jgi:hypothetical protein
MPDTLAQVSGMSQDVSSLMVSQKVHFGIQMLKSHFVTA